MIWFRAWRTTIDHFAYVVLVQVHLIENIAFSLTHKNVFEEFKFDISCVICQNLLSMWLMSAPSGTIRVQRSTHSGLSLTPSVTLKMRYIFEFKFIQIHFGDRVFK